MKSQRHLLNCLALAALATFDFQYANVRAATTIDAANKYAYGANIGWLDWRGDTNNGAVVAASVCSGYIYSANVGWINLGNGAPANGTNYQNNSALDFGVNLDGAGNVRGYAYGANIGWINFENTGAPKVDQLTGKFSGLIYSANCGWISLSNAQAFVQTGTIVSPGPGLKVNPTSTLASSGRTGGPFSPSSQNYALSNAGINSLTWTSSPSVNWLSLVPASGTLAPGSNVTVVVSINANANALPGGSYSENASFINTTTGAGNTSRQVNLFVYTGLNVSGYYLDARGPVGGPFNPDSTDYLLSNLGNSPMSWAITYAPSWLDLSQASGTLAGHASTTVTLTVNTIANSFLADDYSDIIYFTNLTDGVGSQFQSVGLVVTNSLKPVILVQPPHYTVSPGATAAFSVTASGNAPLYYQWQHGSSNISGATASLLTVANVAASQSGHYAAIVSNSWGSVTSSVGTLALFSFDHLAPPTMKITTVVGDRYRVDFADRLELNAWTLLNYFTLSNSPYSVFDTNAPIQNARFYRAVYSP